jgi:hypothetical protein
MLQITTAYHSIQHPEHALGYPAIKIDVARKPVVFDIHLWKKILIALHFEITEPEGNRQADLIEIKITQNVTPRSLKAFTSFLQSMTSKCNTYKLCRRKQSIIKIDVLITRFSDPYRNS